MKKFSMILTLVVILGCVTLAFAGNGGNGGNGAIEGNGNNGNNSYNGEPGNPCMEPPKWNHRNRSDGDGMGQGFKQMGFGFMLGNLSEQEREALLEARDEFLDATEEIREEIHATMETLRSALHGDEVDQAVIDTLLKELYDLKYEFAQLRLTHMLEMKTLVGNFGEVMTIAE